jgi:NADPH:quinone reductase-like Zn-dependent oxidoreductase
VRPSSRQPLAGLTALQALRDKALVRSGHHILIVGAAGGISTFAVQLAKVFGAAVTGVQSTAALDLVRSLGANRVIDYTKEDFTTGEARYDVIFDNVCDRARQTSCGCCRVERSSRMAEAAPTRGSACGA